MKRLALRSIGAFTAGGATAPQTMASIHARFQLFGDSQVRGADGEPLTVAATPINKVSKDARRLADLGSLALNEALAAAPDVGPVPLVVCAPMAGDLGGSEAELLDGLLAAAANPIERAPSRVIARGREGIVEALEVVAELLRPGGATGCCLLGVDSLIGPRRLKKLMKEARILDNVDSDGFVPGEGAAALLFTAREDKQTMAVIAGTGRGREPAVGTGRALTGEGITDALEQALAESRLAPNQIAALALDLSGAHTLGEELALASARAPLTKMASAQVVQIPLMIGEIGAAAGPTALAALGFFLAKGVVVGAATALFTSEGASRGAAVVVRERGRP